MFKGKTLPILVLKQICSSILTNISYSKIKQKYKVAISSVQKYKACLEKAKISKIEEFLALDEEQIAYIIYGERAFLKKRANGSTIYLKKPKNFKFKGDYFLPNFSAYVDILTDKEGVTKTLLYKDYVEEAKQRGLLYMKKTAFFKHLNLKLKQLESPAYYAPRNHEFGDELQLDWCGDQVELKNEKGELQKYSILVLTWASSYYSYACFVSNLTTACTVEAIKSGLYFFKCLPKQLVVDNAKALVTRHEIGHEAILNQNFEYFMDRTGIFVNVNNPFCPNEKSAVEHTVHLIQQRVLPNIKSGTCINEANHLIKDLVKYKINLAMFRGNKEKTREYLFLQCELPKARALEHELPLYYEHLKNVRVLKNGHIKILGNYYSVPADLVNTCLNVDMDEHRIYVKIRDQIVANHKRVDGVGALVTDRSHLNTKCPINSHKINLNTIQEILNYAKRYSNEVLSFCMSIALKKDSLNVIRPSTVYITRLYQKFKNNNAEDLINTAISNVLYRYDIDELNTHLVDKEIKLLQTFSTKA